MRPLEAKDLVRVWELGRGRPPWFRALMLLAPVHPEATVGELARLSLGQRNTRLAGLREATFGAALTAVCACPRCRTVAEFTAAVRDLAPGLSQPPGPSTFEVETQAGVLTCRNPTSEDLAADAAAGEAQGPVALHDPALVARCVQAPPQALSGVTEAVVEGWYAHDPGVETQVSLACDACGEEWNLVFDWERFVWVEVAAAAQRRLEEVHLLAQAYGWREADILALGQARRDFYMDRVRA